MSRDRRAVSVAFLAFGAIMGSWIPRLPTLKDHLHLTDGQVGYALLALAVGAVIGAAIARMVLGRGARAWVRAGTVAIGSALLGPALAGSFAALFISLVLLGACAGFIDMLENAQAAELERIAGCPLINGFHGFWSLGTLLGALLAGAAAFAGVSPLAQFALAAVVAVAGSALFLRDLPDTRSGAPRPAPGGAGRLWLTGFVVAVAAISFCAILVEGGGADWSALYLREFSHADPGIAAGGFAAFALAATLVRFRADFLTANTSPAVVARLGGLIAALGLALAIAVPALPGAIVGFALVGIGTAVLVPLALSAGANLGASGTALTLVLAVGYLGSIAGPAMIGTTADHLGLRVALGIPLVGAIIVIALAGSLNRGPADSRPATAVETSSGC
ncbi:MAG TPA: MFS transporter [Candidatus Dormibacteraeota bacterium]|nr:MFS transporter [Candidatus Dormibacteraeota bacterium]